MTNMDIEGCRFCGSPFVDARQKGARFPSVFFGCKKSKKKSEKSLDEPKKNRYNNLIRET